MEDERLKQIEENTEIIEKCNDTLDQVARTLKLMDDMVGDK